MPINRTHPFNPDSRRGQLRALSSQPNGITAKEADASLGKPKKATIETLRRMAANGEVFGVQASELGGCKTEMRFFHSLDAATAWLERTAKPATSGSGKRRRPNMSHESTRKVLAEVNKAGHKGARGPEIAQVIGLSVDTVRMCLQVLRAERLIAFVNAVSPSVWVKFGLQGEVTARGIAESKARTKERLRERDRQRERDRTPEIDRQREARRLARLEGDEADLDGSIESMPIRRKFTQAAECKPPTTTAANSIWQVAARSAA